MEHFPIGKIKLSISDEMNLPDNLVLSLNLHTYLFQPINCAFRHKSRLDIPPKTQSYEAS